MLIITTTFPCFLPSFFFFSCCRFGLIFRYMKSCSSFCFTVDRTQQGTWGQDEGELAKASTHFLSFLSLKKIKNKLMIIRTASAIVVVVVVVVVIPPPPFLPPVFHCQRLNNFSVVRLVSATFVIVIEKRRATTSSRCSTTPTPTTPSTTN